MILKIPVTFDYVVSIRDAVRIALSIVLIFCLYFFFAQPEIPIKLLALFIFLNYLEEKLDAYLYSVIRAMEDKQEEMARISRGE